MTLIKKTVSTLTSKERDELYRFCFQEMNYQKTFFDTLINQVNEIYFVKNKNDQIKGCCAITYRKLKIHKRSTLLIKTNLVCLSKDWQGGLFLETVGFRSMLKAKLKNPLTPLYWVSVMVSPIAYLLMSNTFSRFYPNLERRTPIHIQSIIDKLSDGPFKQRYLHGIFNGEGLQSLSAFRCRPNLSKTNKKHFDYFVTQNPFFRKGDGLVSVVPLTFQNVYQLIRKHVKKAHSISRTTEPKKNIGEINGVS